ncbi:uncharacterized protein BJX67DRAFT_224262 [Aspergillus lucknowensis]|uniref:C2H2-type domain-containing protein n=1 Tax=Aspergillus lucknowensis TaxID=176173 RepID=A0ABR4LJU1_9EURO
MKRAPSFSDPPSSAPRSPLFPADKPVSPASSIGSHGSGVSHPPVSRSGRRNPVLTDVSTDDLLDSVNNWFDGHSRSSPGVEEVPPPLSPPRPIDDGLTGQPWAKDGSNEPSDTVADHHTSWSCGALQNHQAAFHPSIRGPSADACGYCGRFFSNNPRTDWDERLKHVTEVHNYGKCSKDKKFYRLDHFRQHLRYSHSVGLFGANYVEIACMKEEIPPPESLLHNTLIGPSLNLFGAETETPTPADTTVSLNSTSSKTGYDCPHNRCTLRFESVAQLQRHWRETSHPRKCRRINPSTGEPCDWVFWRAHDLTRHLKTVHTRAKVRCYLCTEEKVFRRLDGLKRHLQVVHADITASARRVAIARAIGRKPGEIQGRESDSETLGSRAVSI